MIECAAGGIVVWVCVCCVWDSLEHVWGSEFAPGNFVVCVCVCVCVSAACGNVYSRFGGVSLQQEALCCVCVCECVCCVWDSLEQVCGIEYAAGGFVVCECVCVLRVGHFWPGFGERVCSRWLCAVCVCVCVYVYVCPACGRV